MMSRISGCYAFVLLLAACSSGESRPDSGEVHPDPTGPGAPPQVRSFEVAGTSRPLLPGAAEPIDSKENDGRFRLQWQIEDDAAYVAKLYVSRDPFPHGKGDIHFAEFRCDAASAECNRAGDLACQFRSDNRIRCGTSPDVDLTPWLERLPQQGYLVFEACRQTSCAGTSEAVEFR